MSKVCKCEQGVHVNARPACAVTRVSKGAVSRARRGVAAAAAAAAAKQASTQARKVAWRESAGAVARHLDHGLEPLCVAAAASEEAPRHHLVEARVVPVEPRPVLDGVDGRVG